MSESVALILAGGSGTRLWPLSRELYPKQLLPLLDHESLFQKTVERLKKHLSPKNIYTITNQDHLHQIQEQLLTIDQELNENVFVEPLSQNTLPAISWFTAKIAQDLGEETIISVFPADHIILNETDFISAWKMAEEIAQQDLITLFGLKPTWPATDYGYIKVREKTSLTASPSFFLESFVEKPNSHTAQNYLNEGGYYWNGGMFFFKAKVYLKYLEEFQPETFRLCQEIAKTNDKTADTNLYSQTKKTSIDYGLMEKLDKAALVPVDIGWSDLGSWKSLFDVQKKDSNQNVCKGDVISVDSSHNYLQSTAGLLATFGIENLCVVQSGDATLVCPVEKSGEVKPLFEEIKKQYPELTKTHQTVFRPWGSYTVLADRKDCKVKTITVNPNQKLSLQLHHKRFEHWVVVNGTATVQVGEDIFDLEANKSVFIPAETKHRLSNKTDQPVTLVEVQVGSYFGEDDIVRFEDQYGRTNK